MQKIEVRVPVEIRDYEKIWFKGLSRRQCISAALILFLFIGGYLFSNFVVYIPSIIRLLVTILLACPIGMVGFLKFRGLYAEQYIPIIIKYFREPKEYSKYSYPSADVIKAVKENQKHWEERIDVKHIERPSE